MGMPWFRMYAEFATDPKVQRMSEVDQRRFLMLLCLRCSNGDVTFHDDDVTFHLRITGPDWQKTKAVFVDKNLIDEQNRVLAWEKRQCRSDSSTARVREHRKKVKQDVKRYETQMKRFSNGLDIDKEEEEDKNKSKSISRARAARSHQIPDGFVPDDKGKAFARDRGLDWGRVLEEFRDYHTAKGSKFTDWGAAWRTWCRKAGEFRAAKAGPAKAQKVEDAWWATERGTEMKARELGVWPARNGESWDGLRARVRARIKDGDAGGDNALAQLLVVQA